LAPRLAASGATNGISWRRWRRNRGSKSDEGDDSCDGRIAEELVKSTVGIAEFNV
jgi:hypothetical protein